MYTFLDRPSIEGHLQITKKYLDGTEDIVFDDHNIIVSGMGVGLSLLFSMLGSNSITDYQMDRFQVGVSGHTAIETSATYQLSGELSSISEYGGNNIGLLVASATPIKDGITTTIGEWFGLIPFHNVTRIDTRSVRYTIILDEDTCNDLQRGGVDVNLNEIGLFMKNPVGLASDNPLLVAYRVFSNIHKTSDFTLIFRWTLRF